MTNRKTKKEFFKEIREAVKGNAELVEFVDHELELLDKKTSAKSAVSAEHVELMTTIKVELQKMDRPVTISEFQKKSSIMAEYSNQKLSAMLKKLVDAQEVTKIIDKKKSYFKIA